MSELYELLASEIGALVPDLAAAFDTFSVSEDEHEKVAAFESYVDILDRIIDVTEMTETEGVECLCTWIKRNVEIIQKNGEPPSLEQSELLLMWPIELVNYLQNPNDSDAVASLFVIVNNQYWPMLLSEKEQGVIDGNFSSPVANNYLENEREIRQSVATEEDVSLVKDEDVSPQVYDAFLGDAPTQAEQISTSILAFIQSPSELEQLSSARRVTHTIKGAAATVGVKGIANLAHHLEDLLDFIAEKSIAVAKFPSLAVSLERAGDCLECMVEVLLGQSTPPSDAVEVLQSILDLANHIDNNTFDQLAQNAQIAQENDPVKTQVDAVALPTGGEQQEAVVSADNNAARASDVTSEMAGDKPQQIPAVTSAKESSTASVVNTKTNAPETVASSIRVPTEKVEDILQELGEVAVISEHMREKLNQLLANSENFQRQSETMQARIFELENFVDIQGVRLVSQYNESSSEMNAEFDALELDRYNELHSFTRAFSEASSDIRALGHEIKTNLSQFTQLFRQQSNISKGISDDVVAVRMVPTSTIVSRLQRTIRQVCRDTGKEADIEITGSDIMVDSEVLNKVAGPIMHVLRNAVDHGIEMPERRIAAGKNPRGLIKLNFSRDGDNFVVECVDDGQGLNYQNIKKTALRRGLLEQDQSHDVSEYQLQNYILQKGFSSRETVTHTSGRGIGMDVVNQSVIEMKGSMAIESTTSKGLHITLRLPITVVSLQLIVVRVNSATFAVPMSSLTRVYASNVGHVVDEGLEQSYKVGDQSYLASSLSGLLGISADVKETINASKPSLLIPSSKGPTVVFVDEVIDRREAVVKPFGRYLNDVPNLLGGVSLANGEIIPVLDMPSLLREPIDSTINLEFADNLLGQNQLPEVLVVEDSISARRSLQLMLSDAGFYVRTAVDGLQAIEAISEQVPDVILTDLEMPNMNGLELASYVRDNSEIAALPIIMITSRYNRKHREQAEKSGVNAYLTKPYSDDDVLVEIEKVLSNVIIQQVNA